MRPVTETSSFWFLVLLGEQKKKALATLKPTARLMAFLLCLISPENYLQFSLGQQAFAIIADNVDLPVRGMRRQDHKWW